MLSDKRTRRTDSYVSCPLAHSGPAYRDVCALTLLAFLLDFVNITNTSVGLDESVSIAYARLSITSLLSILTGGDANMSLYHVLLNLWVRMFGESELAVRSLSAVFGALAVSAIYLLGARLFGRTAGLVAGLLFALDAFIVHYADTARSYAMLVLLVVLSSYFLVVEIEQPSRRNRIAYVLASTLAVYAHYFAAYVLVVHVCTLVALRRRTALTREWLGVAAAIVLLCTPEAIFAFREGPVLISWIKQPTLNDVEATLVELAGGSRVLLFALIAGGCYATVSAVKERGYWRNGFVAAWLVVPIVLSFALSFVQPIFLSRYFIICVPALILFGTAAITSVRRPVAAGALIATFVWLSATQLLAFYTSDVGENWRDATRYVLAATRPGDAIVFYPRYARKPFEYYQRQGKSIAPTNLDGHALEERQRIWLVIRESDAVAHFPEIQQLQSQLSESYRRAAQRRFRNVVIEFYTRNTNTQDAPVKDRTPQAREGGARLPSLQFR